MHINAVASLILAAGLGYVYRAIWDKPMLIRVVLVLIASYIVATIWHPGKMYAQFMYFDDFRSVDTNTLEVSISEA